MSKNNFIEQFKTFLLSSPNSASKVTVKNYLSDINHFIRWYESTHGKTFEPKSVTHQTIEDYKREAIDDYGLKITEENQKSEIRNQKSALSERSLERHLSSLRKFFKFLKLEGHIAHDPFAQQSAISNQQSADPYKIRDFKNYLYVYNASHLTIKNYLIDLRQFFTWAEEVLDLRLDNGSSRNVLNAISPQLLEEYKQRLLAPRSLGEVGFSPATVNRKLSSLRKYLNWAQAEGLISQPAEISNFQFPISNQSRFNQDQFNNETNHQSLIINHKSYSSFPPFRLLQKLTKGINLALDATLIAQIVKIIEKAEILAWKIKGQPVFERLKISDVRLKKPNLKSYILNHKSVFEVKNLKKELYAPLEISTKNFPWYKKAWHNLRYKRPNWYRTYHSYAITHYFHFAVLVIFAAGLVFGFYTAFIEEGNKSPTLAALPTNPPRILSFQGRLTDNNDNPITSGTNLRFAIYRDQTASGSALQWQEVNRVEPDTDGIFNVILGNNTSIPSQVFFENNALWLGVTVETTPELTPRQQIATVAFATNSETLQGLLPITATASGTTNVVLALNSSGNLVIGGSATPTFKASGGQFTLTGQTLILSTNTASNGNIQLAPDGTGKIDLAKPLVNTSNSNNIASAVGSVEIDDLLSVLATSSGQSAFTINQTGGGPLISASQSGTAKFTVDGSGNTTIASGAVYSVGTSTGQTLTNACVNTTGGIVTGTGTCPAGTNYWIQPTSGAGAGALFPANSTVDLLVGGQSTQSAKFAVLNVNSGTPVASVAGNFSLGSAAGTTRTIGATAMNALQIGDTNTGAVQINPNGSTGLYVNGSGNVGIGTTTPNNAIQVANLINFPNSNFGTSLGYQAGGGTGFYNSFVGYQAGYANNSGNANTAIGMRALHYGSIGTNNTATGYYSLYNNTTGGGNTVNGAYAGTGVFGNSDISNNALFGYQAGTALITGGNNNTLLGYNAGLNITSGASNIMLGSGTNAPSATGSNQLNIGNTIYGNLSSGIIGISTTSPTALLHINGGYGANAALIVNQLNNADIFTASASGTTRLTLSNGGNLNLIGGVYQSGGTNGISTSNACVNTTGGIVTGTGTCPAQTGTNWWNQLAGALSPVDTTNDLLLGSTATSSALFSFTGIKTGQTIASISGQLLVYPNNGYGGNASLSAGLVIGANSLPIIQTTRNQALTIGGNTTGNITLSPLNGASGSNLIVNALTTTLSGTTALTASSLGTFTTAATLALNGASTINTDQATVSLFNSTATTLNIGGAATDFNVGVGGATAGTFDILGGSTATGCTVNGDTGNLTCSGNILTTATTGLQGWWNVGSGSLFPTNSTLDFLFGSQASVSARFKLTADNLGAGTLSVASISGKTSFASLVVNNDGVGDLFTASASGWTRFRIAGSGAITSAAYTTGGGVIYTTSNGLFSQTTAGASNECLKSTGGSAPTWGACGSGGDSFWGQTNGLLYPGNSTVDLAIGGVASTSAKFLFANVNSGTPTLKIFDSTKTYSLNLSHDGTNGNIISTTGTVNIGQGGGTLFVQTDIQNDSTNNLGAVQITDRLNVLPAATSNINSNAALIVNNPGTGDILTASASGVPKFTIGNTGAITSGLYTNAGGILYTATSGLIGQTAIGTSAQCLTGGTTPSFSSSCLFSDPYWNQASGALFPNNSTVDLLIGGQSTTSAKFALVNIAGTRGTQTASLSGSLVLDSSTAIIQTTNNQLLTIGGNTTGNITISPLNGGAGSLLTVNAVTTTLSGTTTLTASSLATFTTAASLGVTATTLTLGNGSAATITTTTNGLTLDSGSNTLTIAGTDTTLTASGLTTVNLGTSATINAGATALNLQQDGAIDVNIAGGSSTTGCTISNSTGNLTCSGNIASTQTSGVQGWWQRSLGALSPANITDDLLIGATATSTAQFSVSNIAKNQAVASLSGQFIVMPNNGWGGNVGIGTTSPGSPLTIRRSTAGTALAIRDTANSANNLTISDTGGIDAPPIGSYLKTYAIGINVQSDGLINGGWISNIRDGDYITFDVKGTAGILFKTAGLERMRVTSTGNVGIETTTPAGKLEVTGNVQGKALVIFNDLGNQDIFTGSSSGTTQFRITTAGSVYARSFYDLDNTGYFLDPAATATSLDVLGGIAVGTTSPLAQTALHINKNTLGNTAVIINQLGTGDLITGSASGTTNFLVKNNGDTVIGPGGAGKITVTTIDPLYTIDGTKYSTYAPSMLGVKEEVAGRATLSYNQTRQAYSYTIALNGQGVASDLWLFARVTDLDVNLTSVLLTPDSSAKVWYEKDSATRSITFFADRPTSLSYRLTAPRFDHETWANLSDETNPGITGLIAPPAPNSTSTIAALLNSTSNSGNFISDEFTIGETLSKFGNTTYSLVDSFGNAIKIFQSFSDVLIANIQAGFISAKEITTNSLRITADNVTIGGQSLRDYIASIVQEVLNNSTIQQFNNQGIISPIASINEIHTDLISPLANNHIEISGDINVEGNVYTEGGISARSATISGNLTAGDASISGTLRAGKIIASDIEGLNIKTSTVSANYITNNYYTSTPSGQLLNGSMADIATSSSFPTLAATQQQSSNSTIQQYISVAPFASEFAYVQNLSAQTATFSQGLMVFGPTTLSDTSIVGQLSVNGSLILADNSINVLGSDLNLQPLRQGGLSIMAGLIYIDTNGNATIGGDTTIKGTLYSNIISPIAGGDLTINLASNSANGIQNSKFKIQNSEGFDILGISQAGDLIASGAGTFSKLNLNLVSPALALSPTEVIATGSAGTGSINAGRTQMTINNQLVTDKSLIYITPTTNTNQTLFLLRQVPGDSFTVGIQNPSLTPIQFNWIIVN